MNSKRIRIMVGLLTVCLAGWVSAYAQDATKVSGLITARTGDTIVLKTIDGTSVTVTLDDDTKVQQPKGLGVRKKQMSAAVLIPGLKVSINGTSQDATHFLARTVTFDKNDLQTAEMIQAGLNPTDQKVAANQQNISENKQNISANQQNIEANKQGIDANQQNIAANKTSIDANAAETSKRFSELSEYDTKDQLDVTFASGSTKLSTQDQGALNKLAHNATSSRLKASPIRAATRQ
jgi:OOP family OmpA-OmpF porin